MEEMSVEKLSVEVDGVKYRGFRTVKGIRKIRQTIHYRRRNRTDPAVYTAQDSDYMKEVAEVILIGLIVEAQIRTQDPSTITIHSVATGLEEPIPYVGIVTGTTHSYHDAEIVIGWIESGIRCVFDSVDLIVVDNDGRKQLDIPLPEHS